MQTCVGQGSSSRRVVAASFLAEIGIEERQAERLPVGLKVSTPVTER
jgi:hypothetical protein